MIEKLVVRHGLTPVNPLAIWILVRTFVTQGLSLVFSQQNTSNSSLRIGDLPFAKIKHMQGTKKNYPWAVVKAGLL
jgi:hypothetical protein